MCIKILEGSKYIIYIKKVVETMKKILLFDNSFLLQKAIKLILSNENIYDIIIVDNLESFEKKYSPKKFDLIISHVDLINVTNNKKEFKSQKFLLMFETSDCNDKFKDSNSIYYIDKPFSCERFKNKVNSILGIDERNMSKIENTGFSEQMLFFQARETIEKWLRDEAPKFAKEVIRDEILKLIS